MRPTHKPAAGPSTPPDAPAPAPARKRPGAARLAALCLLFLLPLALRVVPLQHGGERGYVPDAHMVRQALGMARDRDFVPPVGKYSTYPNLVPYLLVPAYGVQYLAGSLAGWWQGPKEYGEHLLEHPQHAAWIARGLVALLGALTSWVIYRAALAAGMRAGAWIAGLLVATGLLHLQLSTHERPWVPMVFFLALSAWGAIAHGKTARALPLVLSGLCAGLAFACHQSGLGALGLPFLAWLLGPLAWRGVALRQRLVAGTLCLVAFAAAGFLLGHPYLLVHGQTPSAAVVGGGDLDEHASLSVGGIPVVFEVRWASFTRLSKAFVGYDPVVLLLGLAGLVLALRERRLRPVAAFTLLWAAFFLTQRSDHVRYLLPLAVLLALPAGLACECWLQKPLGKAAVALLLAVPLLQAARFDWVLTREDTRSIAERQLAQSPPGRRIAIDRYGPLVEPDRGGIALLERVRASCGEGLRPREQHRKQELDAGRAGGGADCVRIEELLEFDERAGTARVRPCLAREIGPDPRAVLATLGVTHVLLVDRRPGDGAPSLALDAAAIGDLVWSLGPTPVDRPPATEAFLPTEMDFPLTALWSVERPGPALKLVALR